MKTLFQSFRTVVALVFSLVALTFISCGDQDDHATLLKEEIVGTWDITSYKVAGDEYIGLAIESASLRFDTYTGDEGEFTEEVTFADEESTSLTGAYSVDDNADKVHMNYEGEVVIAKVEITNGKTMRWDGTQDGYPLVILATKR